MRISFVTHRHHLAPPRYHASLPRLHIRQKCNIPRLVSRQIYCIFQETELIDSDIEEAMNEACDRTLTVVENGDPEEIEALNEEFSSTWIYLMDEKDIDSANFIAVLQGLLEHNVIPSVAELHGFYLRSYKHLYNALRSIDWDIVKENAVHDEDEESSEASQERGRLTSISVDTEYYDILGVPKIAEKSEIKNAYRSLALKLHPDVNQEDDASTKFISIRKAYGKATYCPIHSHGSFMISTERKGWKVGLERMQETATPIVSGPSSNHSRNKTGNPKPEIPLCATQRMSDTGDAKEEEVAPLMGDVVEYPLSDLMKAELQDGREKGVGLLVGRNKDRGDAATLPADLLGMCEIEPLRQVEFDSATWIPDEIGCSAFCNLSELKRIPVASYDSRHDKWVIQEALSDGCGGPEIIEEIVL